MFSIVEELIQTRRELRDVREQLRCVSKRRRVKDFLPQPSDPFFSCKRINVQLRPIRNPMHLLSVYLFNIMAFSTNFATFVKQ